MKCCRLSAPSRLAMRIKSIVTLLIRIGRPWRRQSIIRWIVIDRRSRRRLLVSWLMRVSRHVGGILLRVVMKLRVGWWNSVLLWDRVM